MKNFFKKLAFVLALAMTVATVAPAAKASAAAAPKLNVASKKLYLGGDVTGKYSDTLDLNVKNKGNNKVAYATKDAAIATVDAETGVITAKKVGYVEVVATLTDKDTKKTTTTLTARIWVKQNADAFGLGSLAKVENALTVGDKVKINAYRGLDGVKYWKQADKTVVTDYVKWTSSDATVAKVDAWGTVTAVAPGEATITAYATQTEGSTKTTEAKTFAVKVAAANGIKDVVQVSENEAVVYFNGTPEVTKDTLLIKDTYGQEFLFEEFDYNADNKAAAVKTIENFSDAMVYTVSNKGLDKTFDFTASVGKVASVKINPSTVVAYENTKIDYVVYDKNGIDVTDAAVNDGIIELTVADADASNAYITDNEIYFYEVGKTAKVTLTYHTNEMNADGDEIVFTDSYTFKSQDPSTVKLNYENVVYKIAKSSLAEKDLVDFADGKVGMNITSVADYPVIDFSNKDNKQVYAMLKVNNLYYSNDVNYGGTDLNDNNVGGITFESLDEAKLQIGADGLLTPSATGVAKIKIISDFNERSVIVPIMVVADPYPVSFTFDKQSVSNLSNVNVANNYVHKATFEATIKDQNGNSMDLANVYTEVEGLNDNAKARLNMGDKDGVHGDFYFDGKKIIFETPGFEAGVYKYKITIGGSKADGTAVSLYRTVQFTVVDAGDVTEKFQIVASDDSKDIIVKDDKFGDVTVSYKLVRLDTKGLKYDYVSANDYYLKVKAPNGQLVEVTDTAGVVSNTNVFVTPADAAVATGSSINANVGYAANNAKKAIGYSGANELGIVLRVKDAAGYITKAKVGTYTVSVYAKQSLFTNSSNDKLIGTKTLKVTDTQVAPKVNMSATTIRDLADITVANLANAVKTKLTGTFARNRVNFNRIDAALSDPNNRNYIELNSVVATEKTSSSTSATYLVSRLILDEKFDGGAVKLQHVVTFNKTVTLRTN